MRFFKPKDYRLQTPSGKADGAASTLAARLKGKLMLMPISAAGSTVLFKAHSAATTAWPEEVLGGGARSHAIGGAVGGVLHACLLQPFTHRPPPGVPWWHLRPRLAGLRVLALKDCFSFSGFFFVHAEAQRFLNARGDGGGGAFDFVPPLPPHLLAVSSSVASGGVAGMCYHLASYPFDRALALAHPEAHPGAVAAAAARAGPFALYRGWLRSAAPGVCMGALTFGLYDAVLRSIGH